MMAFKCDACGKYEDFKPGTRKKRILIRSIDCFDQIYTTGTKSFDICEECLNSKVLTLFNQKKDDGK